jgi:hypothetical protein
MHHVKEEAAAASSMTGQRILYESKANGMQVTFNVTYVPKSLSLSIKYI